MLGIIVVELVLLSLMLLIFIVRHALTGWWKTFVGKQLMLMAVAGFLQSGSLLFLSLGYRLSLWVFVLIFGLATIATAGWLYLQWKAR